MTLTPRAVVVHRPTELAGLVARHGTRQQVGFFLRSRGRSIDEVATADRTQQVALAAALGAIPVDWRRVQVARADLDRFVFGPEDVVVVVGQDGLVANVAKYLHGQPVIGLDPAPGRQPGVLVRHPVAAAADLLHRVAAGAAVVEERRMVRARLDDGQELSALNELYVGHPTHQSARYQLTEPGGAQERQSSSGLLVGTGTGATGWCASVALERGLPLDIAATDDALCWFVREAWPSPVTGTSLTQGLLRGTDELEVTAAADLVAFGDGIEADRLEVGWGQTLTLGLATRRLRLVVG